jgi:hypothetical protein
MIFFQISFVYYRRNKIVQKKSRGEMLRMSAHLLLSFGFMYFLPLLCFSRERIEPLRYVPNDKNIFLLMILSVKCSGTYLFIL